MFFIFKVIYIVLSVVSLHYCLVRIVKIDRFKSPLIVFSIVMLWCYISGVLGFLPEGVILLSVLMLVSGPLSFFFHRKEPPLAITKDIICDYLLMFIFLFTFPLLISKNFIFTGWDEFSFWALSIKTIFENNAFYTLDTPIHNTFKSYPPGQQAVQFFFLYFLGWKESLILVVQQTFTCACFLFISSCFTQNKKLISLYTLIIIILYYDFNYDLSNIYVDGLLGAYFSAALVFSIKADINKKSNLIIVLMLFLLPVLKQIGLVFAIYVAFIYSFRQITDNYKGEFKRNLIRFLLNLFVLFIFIGLGYKIWSLYVSHQGIVNNTKAIPLSEYFNHPLVDRFNKTFNEMINRVSSSNLLRISSSRLSLSVLGITVLCLLLNLITSRINSKNKISINVGFLLLLFFSISYLIFLLYCYLMFFKEHEGVKLAAFERYAGSFYYAWLTCSFLLLFSSITSEKKRNIIVVVIVLILVGFANKKLFHDLTGIKPDPVALSKRLKVQEYVSKIKPRLTAGDKGFFIIQHTTGFEKYIYSYLMSPYHTNWVCFSLGKKQFDADVWTCPGNLAEYIKGYKFLTVFKTDPILSQDSMIYNNNKPLTEGNYEIFTIDNNVEVKKLN